MKIIIIGGGASGLTAAVTAAKNGVEVTVLEGGSRPAGKLYATGNGRCNLTNTNISDQYYRSADIDLIKKTIKKFGYQETLHFFHGLGLLFKDRNGYIYPSTGQAATVAELLAGRCRELGVCVKCNTMAVSVKKSKNKFVVKCIQQNSDKPGFDGERETEETADKLILAAGSTAGGFGCRVTGAELAKALGHTIVPMVPALTALKCENRKFFQAVAGVRIEAKITLYEGENRQTAAEDTGELQLTDYGISGIPVFQISRFAGYALLQKKKVQVCIDFLPEYDFGTLLEELKKSRTLYGSRSILGVLSLIFHTKLVKGILISAKIKESKKISEFGDRELKALLCYFKQFSVKVIGMNEMKQAQVCAGGVSTTELTENFMSKKVENLYITGETVDVDGICGGYNLQFAWASGYLAGQAASYKKK